MCLVALKHDAIDDRVLLDLDHDIAGVVADLDVGEQLGGEQVLERLVGGDLRIGLADGASWV